MKVMVKHMDTVAELKLQGVFSPKFSDINNACTIKGLGGFHFSSLCLLMFNKKKCIGGRDAVPGSYLEDSRMKTFLITGLSWTRDTLLNLGENSFKKMTNAQVLNKDTAIFKKTTFFFLANQ